MPDPLIIEVAGVLAPADRDLWTSPETLQISPAGRRPRPLFATSDVCRVFFGRTTAWLKRAEFDLRRMPGPDGGEPVLIEPMRTDTGYRRWRLYDIERLAHLLLSVNYITLGHFTMIIGVIKRVAVMYGFGEDLGDPRLMEEWKMQNRTVREQAIGMIKHRLDEQDEDVPTRDLGEAAEHLVAHAAWAVRNLEEFLVGAEEEESHG